MVPGGCTKEQIGQYESEHHVKMCITREECGYSCQPSTARAMPLPPTVRTLSEVQLIEGWTINEYRTSFKRNNVKMKKT